MAVVTPDLPELFEEAFERAGLEMRSGYDLKTARRSLNILTLEWQNRGINLFTIDSGTLSLSAGTATYTMPTDTIDIIEHTIRTGSGTSQLDTNLSRISVSTYAQKSNKNTQAKPTQIFVQRLSGSTTVTLHPVPDTTYTLAYFRLKGIDSISSGIAGTTTSYVPPRFVPCLVAGMAYYIAMKFSPEKLPILKQIYDEEWSRAAAEDRDNVSLHLVPGGN